MMISGRFLAMMYADKTIERRKHTRVKAQKGIFALLSGPSSVLGQAVNIGPEGLAFRYSGSKERTSAKAQLQLVAADGSLSSDKLTIKTVWDSVIPLKYSFAFIPIRRCGIRFENLTDQQRDELKRFIQKHKTSIGEAC